MRPLGRLIPRSRSETDTSKGILEESHVSECLRRLNHNALRRVESSRDGWCVDQFLLSACWFLLPSPCGFLEDKGKLAPRRGTEVKRVRERAVGAQPCGGRQVVKVCERESARAILSREYEAVFPRSGDTRRHRGCCSGKKKPPKKTEVVIGERATSL